VAPSRILLEHLQERVREMPESSYGVTVVRDDGTRVPDVFELLRAVDGGPP